MSIFRVSVAQIAGRRYQGATDRVVLWAPPSACRRQAQSTTFAKSFRPQKL